MSVNTLADKALFNFTEVKLEAEEVGKLSNQSTVDNTSLRCSTFVINQKKVAERFVNQVKANIAGHKAISATVLDQSIYEHVGIKRIGDTRTHQINEAEEEKFGDGDHENERN